LTQFQADSLLQGKKDSLVLGPYVVTDIIGFGSMGTVYKAQSKVDKHWYAVKVLPSRGVLKLRNAKQIARDFKQVQHPSVIPFADAGAAGSTNFLAWPYVESGLTLQKLVEQRGRLLPGLAAHYLTQVAEGMAICHQKGLNHGLLKPANLLVKADHSIVILDMGMGTLLGQEESVIHTGGLANLASSADCAAPETAIDPTAGGASGDQYSLGCVLYFCLTGQFPFIADNYVTKMMMHQTKPAPPVSEKAPDVPAGMLQVLDRMMAKKPTDRFDSMVHVVTAIRPFGKVDAGPAFSAPAATAEPAAPAKPAPPAARPPSPEKPAAPAPTPPPTLRPPWMQPGGERAVADSSKTKIVPVAGRGVPTIVWFVLVAILSAGIAVLVMNFFKL
jgi:serine/threonine-protein kinase